MASSVAFGLASSFVSSAHPPILSLFVDIVKFPTYQISKVADSQMLIQMLLFLLSIILSISCGKIFFFRINDFGSIRKFFSKD